MINAYPRPDVTADRYRELEVLAMQLVLSMPHQDLSECLIIRDLMDNVILRWLGDERLARHKPQQAVADELNRGTVVRLISAEGN
jgi:hypothetical protein